MPNQQSAPRRKSPVHRHRPGQVAVLDPAPETICFRGQTLAIVRHFFELSCQMGRLPSMLGREFFRAKVSHHAVPSFEDQALFAHDVQQCLEKLDDNGMEIITLVGLYDLTHEETAAILHRSVSRVSQRYSDAIAQLTQLFLDSGLIRRERPDRHQQQMKGRELPSAGLHRKKPCGSVGGGSQATGSLSVHR
jgi:hypothetical protein